MSMSVYSVGVIVVPVGKRWKKFPWMWNEFVAPHPHRVVEVVESDRIDGIDVVVAVEVGVERVLKHHELVRGRPPHVGVDDEHAVETPRDVLGEWRRVAVVE